MVNKDYNKQLTQYLVNDHGLTKEKADDILDGLAECILVMLCLDNKAVNTPFGTMSLMPKGIEIIAQNVKLLETLKNEKNPAEISDKLKLIID